MTAFNVSVLWLMVHILNGSMVRGFSPGPLIKPTTGEVWPKVQAENKTDQFFAVKGDVDFRIIHNDSLLLQDAIARYQDIIRGFGQVDLIYLDDSPIIDYSLDSRYLGTFTYLNISLKQAHHDDDYPVLHMNEAYHLSVTENGSLLSAETIWGVLRGLESFSQLMYLSPDLKTVLINATSIYDYPRFPHRGLLLDTSRHYIPPTFILRLLDSMSYNKMNVFHWHITDDYSFPYVSKKFPELSQQGAFHKGMVYEPKFIAIVIDYARARGIRVVPELDSPGHTRSWGNSHPELLTPCYLSFLPTGDLGPVDPSKESSFEFLYSLFEEISTVFVDPYIHLGGDEVDFSCWKSNLNITKFMNESGMAKNYNALQSFYLQRIIQFVNQQKRQSIVWEEAFTSSTHLPTDTVVQVWKNETYQEVMYNATLAGHHVILSAGWYLDRLAFGGDILKYYLCEALDFPGSDEQKERVLGGEACMWTEVINENNLESTVWPGASLVAEKLWSSAIDTNSVVEILEINNAAKRLEEQTCRMNKRGIHAQPPNGPSICF